LESHPKSHLFGLSDHIRSHRLPLFRIGPLQGLTGVLRTLANPFPSDFYFKKGTILERRFHAEERLRDLETFGPEYVAQTTAEQGELEQLEDIPSKENDLVILPRKSKADQTGDLKDLSKRGANIVSPREKRCAVDVLPVGGTLHAAVTYSTRLSANYEHMACRTTAHRSAEQWFRSKPRKSERFVWAILQHNN